MNYTSYGLTEGLVMASISVGILLALYVFKLVVVKGRAIDFTLVFGAMVVFTVLDVAVWYFNIHHILLDRLYTASNGEHGQLTVFAVMVYALVVYMISMKEIKPKEELEKVEE